VSVQFVEHRIYPIRDQKVMIDVDLAELYGVPTKRLNEQVRRNQKRFPPDFMFQLTKAEAVILRSQFATQF
jgi:ORF6N domain-containing protein